MRFRCIYLENRKRLIKGEMGKKGVTSRIAGVQGHSHVCFRESNIKAETLGSLRAVVLTLLIAVTL